MIPVVQATADTLESVGVAAGRTVDWLEFAASWHEFFLMAGTAAVTLAGLLFVAISIHVDTLVHESREHLLSLARLILFSYVGVMVLSLMMLVPGIPLRLTALELMIVPVPLIAVTVRLSWGRHGTEHAEFSRCGRRATKRPTSGRETPPRTFCRGGTPRGVGVLHLPTGGSP